MHWQGKSVLFEKLALVPAKITFISGQCDTNRSSYCTENEGTPSRAPTKPAPPVMSIFMTVPF